MQSPERLGGRPGVWLHATRPRTLPLGLASIIMGTGIAIASGWFRPWVAVLCVLTACILQILSNLANDYGDSLHGADLGDRKGPRRAVQSGLVTAGQMRRAIIVAAALAIGSGVALLWLAFGDRALSLTVLFILIGGAAVAAAITYTAGRKPYGYAGLGDLAVLIFFGWVGVFGSYFVQTSLFTPAVFLPATSCGLLAVAVLNINNIRDMESDAKAGKNSVPVRLGLQRARVYHWILLLAAVGIALAFVLLHFTSIWQLLLLLCLPLVCQNGLAVWRVADLSSLNPWLKQMSMTTLLFSVLFSAGMIIPAIL
ncbi:MAG TPA: 1,4-dihydroxy-2-naphthoate polyprenyltransferase [Promineifilum sp.]